MPSQKQNWCVLGGGMLGLTVALRLAEAGHRVTVKEAASVLGGLASPWKLGDIVWDRHYHVTLLSDSRARKLIAELGLEDQMVWKRSFTGFYTGGRHISMSSSLDFLLFPALGLVDKFRLGLTIFAASRIQDWKAMESEPVEDWLRRWSGNKTFEKIWLPLLRAKLGEGYKNTSAAFIWATINRLYAARRSGLKTELFGYMRGGYAQLLDRFKVKLEATGVTIACNQPAKRIGRAANGGVAIEFAGGVETFDRVVATMPSPLAVELCPELTPGEKMDHLSVQYQGIVCASLLLQGPLSKYYVTNITDPAPFTGVIDMSALVDSSEFGGKALVYLPKYVAPNDPLFAESDASIRESFLGALSKMYPGFQADQVLAFQVSRVRQVFPVPTLHYSESVPSMKTSIPGLFLVNSTHIVNATLNVNETVSLAERATEICLAGESAAAVPLLETINA